MKTEFVELLKKHIGSRVEGRGTGLSNWLDGKVHAVADDGTIEMEFEVREDMCNPFGVLHGGAMSAIIDEVLGLQLFAQSDETATFLALGLHVDFVKSAKLGELLVAKPQVVRIGTRVATVRCELFDAKGNLVAQGSSNFLRMS